MCSTTLSATHPEMRLTMASASAAQRRSVSNRGKVRQRRWIRKERKKKEGHSHGGVEVQKDQGHEVQQEQRIHERQER